VATDGDFVSVVKNDRSGNPPALDEGSILAAGIHQVVLADFRPLDDRMAPRSSVIEKDVAVPAPADSPGKGFAEQVCVLLPAGIRYEKQW
jgi:hypothetical protein